MFLISISQYEQALILLTIFLIYIAEDTTFADRYGRNPPGYASAGDCYSRSNCAQGRFMVSLTGTGLKVKDSVVWRSRGYHTSQKIRRHKVKCFYHSCRINHEFDNLIIICNKFTFVV